MRRLHRYGFALLRGFNAVMSGELKTLDSYKQQLASDDPDMMAAVYDFHLEVDDMLAELDRELAALKSLVHEAFEEGSRGGSWEASQAKETLEALME